MAQQQFYFIHIILLSVQLTCSYSQTSNQAIQLDKSSYEAVHSALLSLQQNLNQLINAFKPGTNQSSNTFVTTTTATSTDAKANASIVVNNEKPGTAYSPEGEPKSTQFPHDQFICSSGYGGSFKRDYRRTVHRGTDDEEYTGHMLEAHWSKRFGWDPAYILPLHNISLHPSARVLLYSQQVFESIRAQLGVDNRIRLFRPEKHLERLKQAAGRLSLPEADPDELLLCIKRLLLSDSVYFPSSYTNGSLEVRVVISATEPSTAITSKTNGAILYAFLVKHTGADQQRYRRPQILFASPKYSRSVFNSLTDVKSSVNYGLAFHVLSIASTYGCTDVLWLSNGDENILDLNQANIFFLIINDHHEMELITPPSNGLIRPGIRRQAIIDMTKYWNEFSVTERTFSIYELRSLVRQRRVLEVFAVNVIIGVAPVTKIYYDPDKADILLPTLNRRSPLFLRLNRAFHSIEFGFIDHPWGFVV